MFRQKTIEVITHAFILTNSLLTNDYWAQKPAAHPEMIVRYLHDLQQTVEKLPSLPLARASLQGGENGEVSL